MTDEEKEAMRKKAAELVDAALRSPLVGLGLDEATLHAMADLLRALLSDALIDGYARGFAAATLQLKKRRGGGPS
ncbi:MAG: hypothetical protein IT378_08220 [Sandaracinaceae bacterium]|nr:hypothetical protein [Sandaracinaceae bacterium]